MRALVVLVPDKNTEHVFRGLFGRPSFEKSLGCRQFDFDPQQDLVVDSEGNDPGVWKRGHELLRGYTRTHSHALVVLDARWDGSPGVEAIRQRIEKNLRRNGWAVSQFAVIVIDPELENWVWVDSPQVAAAFGYPSFRTLRQYLANNGFWMGEPKPSDPKAAVESVLRAKRLPRSSARYRQIAQSVSPAGCQDPAFSALRDCLRRWFPP